MTRVDCIPVINAEKKKQQTKNKTWTCSEEGHTLVFDKTCGAP